MHQSCITTASRAGPATVCFREGFPPGFERLAGTLRLPDVPHWLRGRIKWRRARRARLPGTRRRMARGRHRGRPARCLRLTGPRLLGARRALADVRRRGLEDRLRDGGQHVARWRDEAGRRRDAAFRKGERLRNCRRLCLPALPLGSLWQCGTCCHRIYGHGAFWRCPRRHLHLETASRAWHRSWPS